MDITNIFCQSLSVTSHAKTFLTVCRFRTNLVSVCKNCYPFERLGLCVRKRICLKINFRRVSIPKPFRRQPHASNDLLFSRSRTLRILFTNVSYMNSYASLLLSSHLRFHIINRLSTVSTTVLVNTEVFFNKFPENNISYLLRFCSL